MIRNEATIEEWSELYQWSTFLNEMEPWRKFWDVDLISLRLSAHEEPVYCSVLGSAGNTYGLVFYEGEKGLEKFSLVLQQERAGVPFDYAMLSQNNLSVYWGDRQDVDPKQLKVIKELGYKYRGHNKWLYFVSYRAGYYPYMPDQEEVRKLIRYTRSLVAALEYQMIHRINVDYQAGEMYEFTFDEAVEKRRGGVGKLPKFGFSMAVIQLDDPELVARLKARPKTKTVLEVDLSYLMAQVKDKKYSRPILPQISVIADHTAGIIIHAQMTTPEEGEGEDLVNTLIAWILNHGRPRKILARNQFVEGFILDLCTVCGIKTEYLKELETIEFFLDQLNSRTL